MIMHFPQPLKLCLFFKLLMHSIMSNTAGYIQGSVGKSYHTLFKKLHVAPANFSKTSLNFWDQLGKRKTPSLENYRFSQPISAKIRPISLTIIQTHAFSPKPLKLAILFKATNALNFVKYCRLYSGIIWEIVTHSLWKTIGCRANFSKIHSIL